MLFDLKGKRRRTVQGVYVTLAVLMGAGLVLFGIGSSVNGGLFDAFNGGGGSNQADKAVQKRIDTANKTLATDPKNAAAMAALVRGHYDLASQTADPNTSEFTKDSLKELTATDAAWQRYLDAVKKPDVDLARRAVQAEDGLARLQSQPSDQKPYWTKAADAAEIIAAAQPTPNNYVALVQYATLAGQTRKADLAGQKAVALAPKAQKKIAKQTVAQVKANPQGSASGAQPAPGQ
jgi:hypothetical protein